MQTYRLINNKTKEETICSLVTIDSFDYYVSDDKIIENISVIYNNKIYSTVYSNTVPQGEILLSGFGYVMKSSCKKVIATNNPNIDIPKVIDETEESFNIVDDIKVRYSGEEADLWCSYKIGFGDGYNKAKETYQYTEEDIIEFAQYVLDNISYNNDKLEEMLFTWKKQQIKTIYYE